MQIIKPVPAFFLIKIANMAYAERLGGVYGCVKKVVLPNPLALEMFTKFYI